MGAKRSSKKKKKSSSACPPMNGKIASPYANICLLSAVSLMKDGATDFVEVQTGTKENDFEFNLRQDLQPVSSNSEDRSSLSYGNVVGSGLADPTETMKCAPVGISSPYLVQRSANGVEMDRVHFPHSEPLCISSNSMDSHSHEDLRSEDSNFLTMITSPWKYFVGQINGGNSLRTTTLVESEKERQRVYNTMFHVPWRCELLIDVGFFVCLDSFLSLLTIMPMRILITLWRFLYNWRLFQRPYADELSDFGCLVVLICGVTLLQLADISRMYHIIRGQGTIKLYVVYNVLEIFDKLCQSFGADVLQVLFNSAEGVASCPGENLTFEIMRFILDQLIAVTAFIVHSFIILAQAITLSAAIISHNNSLLALLVSNNFAEIKSNVFKRVGKDNLHKMAYYDTVERFHIMAYILFVLAQNILESDGPWFWSFVKNASLIWLCEILVDVIKHAFLAKFNEIKPAAYSEFLEALCNQTHRAADRSAFGQAFRFLSVIPIVTSVPPLPTDMSPVLAKLEWPEPIQRVQTLAEGGIKRIPAQYVRPQNERPREPNHISVEAQIPVIDMSGLQETERRHSTMEQISNACKHWGFFQLTNHGIPAELMKSALEICKQFFKLDADEKEKHANDPLTYVGYGSRVGVQKDATLDWGDYYFHYFLPVSIRNENKWPSNPPEYRKIMETYCESISELLMNVLSVFSENLGLPPDRLKQAFGGEDESEVCVRVNYCPACPQPDLTFGVSPHSDPGGITFLLQDDVGGLEVRKDNSWVPVYPAPNALVVNVGDQIEILSNGIYKSIEHRARVNQKKERMSIAVFCNPNGHNKIGPLKEVMNDSKPPSYSEMTWNQYRMFIRTAGTKGKAYVNSISSDAK